MSLLVGLQSVLFYVLSCTPCSQVVNRHKAKTTAKVKREEKARVVAEQPHIYHHPVAFTTNPFWAEEIRMGPHVTKGRNGKYILDRDMGSKELASKELGSKELGSKERRRSIYGRRSTTQEPSATKPPTPPHSDGSPTVVQEEDTASAVLSQTASVSTGDICIRKPDQREDEVVWGHEFSKTGQKLFDAIKQAGTTAGRFVESKLGIEKPVTERDRQNFYFKNPPVNDHHPPIVRSKPAHPDALSWMLQPPPPAKFMEARVPLSRATSTTSAQSRQSRQSRRTAPRTAMGRRVGERALEAKLRNGETPHNEHKPVPTTSPKKTRSRRGTTSSSVQTWSRGTTAGSFTTSGSDDEEEMYRQRSIQRRHKSRRAYATPMPSEDSEDEYISIALESLTGIPSTAVQKPRLAMITRSDSGVKRRVASEPVLAKLLQDVVNMSAEGEKVPGEELLATSVDSGVGMHFR
ncbi:hypothetical protein QBC39DRAFT_5529 [Podospora conica]|nr:hypothetical protein QBC39DRAFT_5529 [Schizothecium conicum]